MENINKTLEDLRRMGERLVPYTFPQRHRRVEADIAPLKVMEGVKVDGYNLCLFFSKSRFRDCALETFQIYGMNVPYLSFHLVVKLAKRMLGSHHLALTEFYQDNHKVYCWTLYTDLQGCPISDPEEEEEEDFQARVFEGFEYRWVDPQSINLY